MLVSTPPSPCPASSRRIHSRIRYQQPKRPMSIPTILSRIPEARLDSQAIWLARRLIFKRRPAMVNISAIFSLSGALTRESPESVASAASHVHDQPSHSGHYWSTVGQQAQPYRPNFLSWDGSFASTVASEAPTVTATPGSGKSLFCFGMLEK